MLLLLDSLLQEKSGWPIRMRGLSRSSPPSTSTGRGGSRPARPGSCATLDLASRPQLRLASETTLTKSVPSLERCPSVGVSSPVVAKLKMNRTAVIRRDYLHYVKKYNRFEKRHKNISVHLSPCFRDTAIGDTLTVGECRPLSKTVKYNTLKVSKSARSKKAFSKF